LRIVQAIGSLTQPALHGQQFAGVLLVFAASFEFPVKNEALKSGQLFGRHRQVLEGLLAAVGS